MQITSKEIKIKTKLKFFFENKLFTYYIMFVVYLHFYSLSIFKFNEMLWLILFISNDHLTLCDNQI